MKLAYALKTPIVRWRARIFVLTWVCYAAYYLTRKNYAVALPEIIKEFGWSKSDVGIVVTAYLASYAVGQFVNGVLGDRLGARRLIALGFGLTAAMSIGLGMSGTIFMMTAFYGINGLAQSTGWPSVNKVMASWYPPEVRGRVMGWWGTNYAVGSALASGVSAFVMDQLGWRAAFYIPAAMSIGVGGLIVLLIRNKPEDVGLPFRDPVIDGAPVTDGAPVIDGDGANAEEPAQTEQEQPRSSDPPVQDDAKAGFAQTMKLITDWRISVLGAAYFGIKFVRYAIDFWLPLYFVEQLSLGSAKAGYLMAVFPLAGIAGPIFGGWLSDRIFDARRGPPSVLMMLGMCGCLLLLRNVGADPTMLAVALFGIGFFLYGPDMLLSGTAAQDFGGRDGAATAAGFVNGCGSIGAAVQGMAVPMLAETYGWDAVFVSFIAVSLACAAIAALLWREKAAED